MVPFYGENSMDRDEVKNIIREFISNYINEELPSKVLYKIVDKLGETEVDSKKFLRDFPKVKFMVED